MKFISGGLIFSAFLVGCGKDGSYLGNNPEDKYSPVYEYEKICRDLKYRRVEGHIEGSSSACAIDEPIENLLDIDFNTKKNRLEVSVFKLGDGFFPSLDYLSYGKIGSNLKLKHETALECELEEEKTNVKHFLCSGSYTGWGFDLWTIKLGHQAEDCTSMTTYRPNYLHNFCETAQPKYDTYYYDIYLGTKRLSGFGFVEDEPDEF